MTQRNNQPRENNQVRKDKHARPENKDNLDSRKNEEWDEKGDDITHNKKEVHSEGKTVKTGAQE